MITKIKKLFSMKNFIGVKISAGVIGAIMVVVTCIVLTGEDEPVSATGMVQKSTATEIATDNIARDDTTNMEETSNDVITDSPSEQVAQNISTEESLEMSVPVADSTSIQETIDESKSTSESITTQISTTSQSKATSQTSTSKTTVERQSTTQKQTSTAQAPTTTQPETTTEEKTTEPLRAKNGVILEQLTMYFREYMQYTVPGSWAQTKEERNSPNLYGVIVTASDVPKYAESNAFHNEIRIYNSEDGTGSLSEDIVDIYGQPWYMEHKENYSVLYYKYLDWGVSDDDRMYARFRFFYMEYNGEKTDKLLYDVTFGPYESFESTLKNKGNSE